MSSYNEELRVVVSPEEHHMNSPYEKIRMDPGLAKRLMALDNEELRMVLNSFEWVHIANS